MTVPCYWCGQDVRPDGHEWRDESMSAYCEIHVEGCGACDDGEPHPHSPEGVEALEARP